jgi:hypothetical protein
LHLLTFTKLSRLATQLPLFQSPRLVPNWESMPPEIQQQIKRLLARMLREHATRLGSAVPQGDRDE